MSGYSNINFSSSFSRTGRRAIPLPVSRGPSRLRNAKEGALAIKGVALFNSMPLSLRNSDHGDIAMFKNHLDYYLSSIPDQPTFQQ